MTLESSFGPGDLVLIGGVIEARIEEVIFARHMDQPMLLVEWRRDGDLVTRRVHQSDVARAAGNHR